MRAACPALLRLRWPRSSRARAAVSSTAPSWRMNQRKLLSAIPSTAVNQRTEASLSPKSLRMAVVFP